MKEWHLEARRMRADGWKRIAIAAFFNVTDAGALNYAFGYRPTKEQRRRYARTWREKNRGKVQERQRRRYAKNKEKNAAWHKAWAAKNREHLSAYHAKWREENREYVNMKSRLAMRAKRAQRALTTSLPRLMNPVSII
jgi:hypothetical protein